MPKNVILYSFPENKAVHVEKFSSDVRPSIAAMHNAYDALSHVISQRRKEISPQRHWGEYQFCEKISIANRGFRDVTSSICGFCPRCTMMPPNFTMHLNLLLKNSKIYLEDKLYKIIINFINIQ